MNLRDIAKPLTAKRLNESLAKRFGVKIKLENYGVEELEDVRNKLRTKLSQFETNESYDSYKSDTYQKNKLFLDVLNAEIMERAKPDANKNGIPDYAEDGKGPNDLAKDKKTDEGAYGKKKKKKKVAEGKEDEAELVMASKDMVDRVTGWMEDTAEMQTESMLELADAIRDEMGQEMSDKFVSTVKPALESLYTTMEGTRAALTSGVGMLTGEAEPVETMGADLDAPVDDDMGDADLDVEIEPADDDNEMDDFATAEPAAGGDEEAGRARRESIERVARLGRILSSR